VILAHNLLRVRARTVARSDSENHRPTADFDPGVVEASDGQTQPTQVRLLNLAPPHYP
jgi:hypothetical protein